MNYRKSRRNVRAISPIIATLLLIAIAVVAALVTYAWVMGYIGFQTGNAGKSIQIQSMTDTTTKITVYVQNTGSGSVSFPTSTTSPFAYVNGTSWTATASPSTIAPGATSTIALTNTGPALYSGEQVTVKISTTSGTYSQVTQALP